MIRDVIVHINNEQPLLADLFEPPAAGDVGLRCTNLRQLNGKRPVFVDDVHAMFFFPYLHIRFLEIPPGAMSGSDRSQAMAVDDERGGQGAPPAPEAEPDLEIDEDFLRRIREV